MDDEFDGLGGSLLAAQDVLEAVLQEVDAAALRQLKAASVAWCAHVRRELCNRLWVRLSRREGQPEPASVDSITDLDVECLNEAGRPWEVVVAGRQLPQLARLHGFGFVVDVQAVREAYPPEAEHDDDEEEDDEDDVAPIGGDTLRSCIQGEGQPPHELLLAAVACAASGRVHGVPVERLREDDAIDELDLSESGIGVTGATLLAFMLPAAMSVRSLDLCFNHIGVEGASALAAVLKETRISTLNVGFNNITGDAAAHLAKVVLEHAVMTDFCGIPLVSLRENSITELNLERKGVGEPGAIVLSKLLPSAAALASLNLYLNNIGDEGASALAAILKETKITNLNIRYNRIGDEGASALAAVLKETSMISHLDLGYNNLYPEEI